MVVSLLSFAMVGAMHFALELPFNHGCLDGKEKKS
jgi:hypothetical protein